VLIYLRRNAILILASGPKNPCLLCGANLVATAHKGKPISLSTVLVTNIEHFPRECDIFKKALKKTQGMFKIADVWHQKLRERKSLERSSVRLYWDPITEKRKRVEKAGEEGGIKRTKYQN
jgi:hypothetical protein